MKSLLQIATISKEENQPRGAWSTVIGLSLIAIISWLDRLILTLLVTPIQSELGITDSQFGILLGLGFVIVFVLAGFPIASFLDRGNRKRILIYAVILWCLSTIAAGFADSFVMLLILRAGVAIGEAALMPAAISMISDHFPTEKRRVPTSVLMAVNILGATGAFLIGGLAIAYFDGVGPLYGLSSWRLTLIAVGLMGLPIIAIFALFAKEPQRPKIDYSGTSTSPILHLRSHATLYLAIFAGAGLLLMLSQGSAAWLSTLLVRGYDFTPAQTGPFMALTFTPTSILGVLLLPLVIGPLKEKALVLRIIKSLLLVCALSVPFVFVAGLGELPLLLGAGALAMLGQGAVVAIIAVLVQNVTPAQMRARMMAIYYIFMNLIAAGFAPVAVATSSSVLFDGPQSLGYALSLVAGVGIACATLLFVIAYHWMQRNEIRS